MSLTDKEREYMRRYYAKNKDRAREYNRQYYLEHGRRKREVNEVWRSKNTERIKETRRVYREANKDRLRGMRRERYEANKSEVLRRAKEYIKARPKLRKEINRRYSMNHKQEIKERNKAWRAKKYGLTVAGVDAMWTAQGGLCAGCAREMLPWCEGRTALHAVIDHCHKTGRVRGLLHQKCNVLLGHIEIDLGRIARLLQYAGASLPTTLPAILEHS